ncbi:MAG: ABC transporter ATP-binding protein [Firmicutes bacterium]|nr:ABC transporter ATP-binding protein [Bacillota bacterium]
MLEVQELYVHYGEIAAVRNVSMTVDKGRIVCLIGNNGAGKTSTLMAVSGAHRASSGRITLKGQPVTGLPADRVVRRGLVLVPEGRRIFPSLSVEENLLMGAVTNRRRAGEALARSYRMFPVLRDRRRQPGGSLSGGEQQMLAVGRALMAEPELVMFDEPSLGLAPKIVDLIFETISRLREEGLTVLLVEQNVSLALEIADYGYVMESGEIKLSGSAAELSSNSLVREIYLGV